MQAGVKLGGQKNLLKDHLRVLYQNQMIEVYGSELGHLIFCGLIDRQVTELRRMLLEPGYISEAAERWEDLTTISAVTTI